MLGDDQVHLWYTDPNQVSASLLSQYRELLSPDELTRCERFYFEEDRRLFLVSHSMVRVILASYTAAAPRELQFMVKGQGKPYLAGFGDNPPVQFNLSHTRGMAVLGVTRQHDIGVDVEQIKPSTNLEVANRSFSIDENRLLRSTPPEKQRALFFRFWTLKEAYLKARALGIGFPLQSFAFQLHAGKAPRIAFAETVGDDPQNWQFLETEPQPDFPVAVAVRRPPTQTMSLVSRSVVPLSDEDVTP